MSVVGIRQQIETLLGFLEPHLPFANCHMVDFFTQSCYRNFIPEKILQEIDNIGQENIINLIFKNNFTDIKTPNLEDFINNSTKFTLKNTNVCMNVDDFSKKFNCDVDKFKLEIFMNAKKSHEVEILSAVAASVAKISHTSHVIDLGDGKGYLSSLLALHHKIPVLGVDASNINTCGAIKRANKLAKVWKGIPNNPHRSLPKKNEDLHNLNVNLYKQVTEFVDENFDLERLILENFNFSTERLGLVGLHTCGDLASDSLKIFHINKNVRSVCNVGCCYHLVTESTGFPLSDFLKSRNFCLGRSARMIANQSTDRILETRELPNMTIYYRALLQVLIETHCEEVPTKHVGKFRKTPKNFSEYVREATKRIDVSIEISDKEIDEISQSYESRINELNIFYLLRSKLSPVIESLILLDRVLFLVEKGYENTFLVQFFNPVVSPRCYGIVAIKM